MTGPDKEERQIITKMIIKACADSFHDWQVYESYYAKNAKSEYDSDSSGDMMYVPNSDVILDSASPPLLEKNNYQSYEQVAKFGHALRRCPDFLFTVRNKKYGQQLSNMRCPLSQSMRFWREANKIEFINLNPLYPCKT